MAEARPSSEELPLTADLCEVLGAHAGDGFTNVYSWGGRPLYEVQFSGHARHDYEYYNKFLQPTVRRLLGLDGKLSIRDGNTLRLTYYSKDFFLLLTNRFGFPAGRKSHTVKLPEEVFTEERLAFAAVRGIFDTDGCVFFDRRPAYRDPYPRVSLHMVSGPLFEQLQNFLSSHFSLRAARYNHRYFIEVYGHVQLARWMETIGFSNPHHLNRIALLPR